MIAKHIFLLSFCWLPINSRYDNSFKHNIDYTTDDSGERFKLHSSGILSDVVDLDVVTGIKRLLCVDDVILLVTNDSKVGVDWKVGQLLVASSRWHCNGTEHSPGTGIYAKITNIYFPTDRRLSIHVVPAGPFDVIEEADIHFRYTPGQGDVPPETRTRHRRYLSNILTKLLGTIDWQANFSTRIPFNENPEGLPERQFTIHKSAGEHLLNLTFSELETSDDFKVQCIECHSRTDLSYIFELQIKKVDNKPRLLKYTSQLEAETELKSDVEVEFSREMGVNYSRPLWETGPIELIRIPVAVVRPLPPLELTLSYNTQVYGQVYGYSRRPATSRTGFKARGMYTMSQNFPKSSSLHTDISSYNWESQGQDESKMVVKDTLNFTFAVYQKITFNASISWKAKDIVIDLSPPMEITIKPMMKFETAVEEHVQCVESSLAVQGLVSISKAELTVEAFGISIWDVVLSPQISKQDILSESVLSRTCLANCFGPSELGPPLSDAEVCGHMKDRVLRGTQPFERLQALQGSELIFSGEESDYDWCGDIGSPCISCDMASETNTKLCADRIVSARLAPAITKLNKFVKAEWNNVSLVVLEAWDEPTSAFPNGQHGNSSLHYEGRKAVVTITSYSGEDDNEKITRLGALAVCSGFEFVMVNKEDFNVRVAVRDDGHSDKIKTSEEEMFADMFNDISIDSKSKDCAKIAPRLKIGDTIPPDQTVEGVCGPPQGHLDRVNKKDLSRLYYYDKKDVQFSPEGRTSDVCGHSTRQCRSDCSHYVNMTEPWTWCSTRLMSPRMALKLRTLAKLAAVEGIIVQVEQAFTESVESVQHYFKEGRGLRLSSTSGITQTERLAVLAACSGFDIIHFMNASTVEVFVRSHGGIIATRVEYPDEDATRLAVDPPPLQFPEYQYPTLLREEAVSPHLTIGYDTSTFLSEHYKVEDFLCPNRQYFRADASLLLCLDLVTDEYGQKVEILPGSGYRTQSVNMINFDIRHPEERYRFQTGQAVELRPPRYREDADLLTLAKKVFRSCTPFLRDEMRGVGIGCHQDRLYLDIRPLQVGFEMDYISVWEAEKCSYCRKIVDLQQELLAGGPVIVPFNQNACSYHLLGQKFYLTFEFQQRGMCSTSDQPAFCSSTVLFRSEQSQKLQERMTSAAGYGRLPRRDIHYELDQCTVALCGGCAGSGTIWDKKVQACSVVVDKFISRATRAFPDLNNRAAFFNTEAIESSVHSLACHDGNVCVENIQLYSLFMPLVTSQYRPDPTGSIERMMFSADRNPTPLLELVEQEMAYQASGKVKVFIEHQSDVKDIRAILKVLMVYNKNVTEVQFHVSDELDVDLVTADLQRNLDVWAGSTCPEHSRFAVAPFKFHYVTHARRKRSLERSESRNEARRRVHHWDLDWMMKLL